MFQVPRDDDSRPSDSLLSGSSSSSSGGDHANRVCHRKEVSVEHTNQHPRPSASSSASTMPCAPQSRRLGGSFDEAVASVFDDFVLDANDIDAI